MNWKSLMAATAAFSFASTLSAQSCPRQQAQDVPLNIQYGAPQNCGSVSYSFGGVNVSSGMTGCPLFVLITPPHQVAAPSDRKTRTEVVGQVPVTIHYFTCEQDWFVIIPLGSSCTFRSMNTIYNEDRLRTVDCVQ